MTKALKKLEARLYGDNLDDVDAAIGELVSGYIETFEEDRLSALLRALPRVTQETLDLLLPSLASLGERVEHKVEAILPFLDSEHHETRLNAIRVLWDAKGFVSEEALEDLQDDADDEVQAYALLALADITSDDWYKDRIRKRPKVIDRGPAPIDHPIYREPLTVHFGGPKTETPSITLEEALARVKELDDAISRGEDVSLPKDLTVAESRALGLDIEGDLIFSSKPIGRPRRSGTSSEEEKKEPGTDKKRPPRKA